MNKTEQIINTIKENYQLSDEKIIQSLVKEFLYSPEDAQKALTKYKESVKVK